MSTHATPTPINLLKDFLTWSAEDGRVGEVRHSKLVDQAETIIKSHEQSTGHAVASLKATFESAARALWDEKAKWGPLIINPIGMKRVAVLQAVTDRAEAEYMMAVYQVQYTQAGERWDKALNDLQSVSAAGFTNS
jgi:hypothetical protein